MVCVVLDAGIAMSVVGISSFHLKVTFMIAIKMIQMQSLLFKHFEVGLV